MNPNMTLIQLELLLLNDLFNNKTIDQTIYDSALRKISARSNDGSFEIAPVVLATA